MRMLGTGFVLENLIVSIGMFVLTSLLCGLVFSILYRVIKQKSYFDCLKRSLVTGFLLSYCMVYLYATLLSRGNNQVEGMELVPFHSVFIALNPSLNDFFLDGLVIVITSIFVGIPLGMLFPLCLQHAKRWWVTRGYSLLFVSLIEGIQLWTGRRVFSIDYILFLWPDIGFFLC